MFSSLSLSFDISALNVTNIFSLTSESFLETYTLFKGTLVKLFMVKMNAIIKYLIYISFPFSFNIFNIQISNMPIIYTGNII